MASGSRGLLAVVVVVMVVAVLGVPPATGLLAPRLGDDPRRVAWRLPVDHAPRTPAHLSSSAVVTITSGRRGGRGPIGSGLSAPANRRHR